MVSSVKANARNGLNAIVRLLDQRVSSLNYDGSIESKTSFFVGHLWFVCMAFWMNLEGPIYDLSYAAFAGF